MPIRVLIVEDQAVYQDLARDVCVAAGWQDVRLCASVADAQRALCERPSDLVLIDYTLYGDMTGADLVRWIRTQPALDQLVCCAWTGYDPAVVDDVFDAIIPKPVAEPSQAILQVLSAVLQVAAQHQTNRAARVGAAVGHQAYDAQPVTPALRTAHPWIDRARRWWRRMTYDG